MPPVMPNAISATSIPNFQLPTSKKTRNRCWELEVGSWELFGLLDLLDLATQHFALRNRDLLAAGFARFGAGQQLPGALAGDDDELEPVLFRCSFHEMFL